MEIWKRIYDNPKNDDGTDKPNELLGEFEILEELFVDDYQSARIGEKDGVIYVINEYEVSGRYLPIGGSKFEIHELKSLRRK
jgi:hypothetical protein